MRDLNNWADTSLHLVLKKRPNPASFCLFSFFLHDKYITINDKSIDGVLGTQTRGGRMVGPEESTQQWRPPCLHLFLLNSPTPLLLPVKNKQLFVPVQATNWHSSVRQVLPSCPDRSGRSRASPPRIGYG